MELYAVALCNEKGTILELLILICIQFFSDLNVICREVVSNIHFAFYQSNLPTHLPPKS